MSDFTLEIPDEGKYLQAVRVVLEKRGFVDISKLLEDSTCTITHEKQFSRKRWNAYWTTVNFLIPISKYETVLEKITEEVRENIRSVCDEIMPPKSGLDIMGVKFSLSLEDTPIGKDLIDDLKKISDNLPIGLRSEIMPEEIKQKARQMSEMYIYLYCVENALRAFIEKISIKHYGKEYLAKLNLNATMKRKIKNRRKSKEKKKWLSVRGDSDIFYLDLADLATLIRNNWGIFEPYFESQEWIVTNISEIASCRHPVAHHSYLKEDERDIIRVNFRKIMKQISEAFEED